MNRAARHDHKKIYSPFRPHLSHGCGRSHLKAKKRCPQASFLLIISCIHLLLVFKIHFIQVIEYDDLYILFKCILLDRLLCDKVKA